MSNSIYCGRDKGGKVNPIPADNGWLGNPVVIGKLCPICKQVHSTAGSTLKCYEIYLKQQLEDPFWKAEFVKLKGQEDNLWCFCIAKGQPNTCHTSVMKKYLREL